MREDAAALEQEADRRPSWAAQLRDEAERLRRYAGNRTTLHAVVRTDPSKRASRGELLASGGKLALALIAGFKPRCEHGSLCTRGCTSAPDPALLAQWDEEWNAAVKTLARHLLPGIVAEYRTERVNMLVTTWSAPRTLAEGKQGPNLLWLTAARFERRGLPRHLAISRARAELYRYAEQDASIATAVKLFAEEAPRIAEHRAVEILQATGANLFGTLPSTKAHVVRVVSSAEHEQMIERSRYVFNGPAETITTTDDSLHRQIVLESTDSDDAEAVRFEMEETGVMQAPVESPVEAEGEVAETEGYSALSDAPAAPCAACESEECTCSASEEAEESTAQQGIPRTSGSRKPGETDAAWQARQPGVKFNPMEDGPGSDLVFEQLKRGCWMRGARYFDLKVDSHARMDASLYVAVKLRDVLMAPGYQFTPEGSGYGWINTQFDLYLKQWRRESGAAESEDGSEIADDSCDYCPESHTQAQLREQKQATVRATVAVVDGCLTALERKRYPGLTGRLRAVFSVNHLVDGSWEALDPKNDKRVAEELGIPRKTWTDIKKRIRARASSERPALTETPTKGKSETMNTTTHVITFPTPESGVIDSISADAEPLPKLLYTRKEVGHLLSISQRSVAYLIESGVLPVRRMGGRVLHPAEAVHKLAETGTPAIRKENAA